MILNVVRLGEEVKYFLINHFYYISVYLDL